jgi:hypothetical protein
VSERRRFRLISGAPDLPSNRTTLLRRAA